MGVPVVTSTTIAQPWGTTWTTDPQRLAEAHYGGQGRKPQLCVESARRKPWGFAVAGDHISRGFESPRSF